MANSNKTSSEAEYDDILSRLDALLSKHEGSPSTLTEEDNAAGSRPIPIPFVAPEQTSLTASDDIPILTETVLLPPSMLTPQSDITSLLEQILDSSLRDAGLDLDARARAALVQALEHRLFGF